VESRHLDWIAFALKWAELSALVHTAKNPEVVSKLSDLRGKLN